jgi:hypothetical protein
MLPSTHNIHSSARKKSASGKNAASAKTFHGLCLGLSQSGLNSKLNSRRKGLCPSSVFSEHWHCHLIVLVFIYYIIAVSSSESDGARQMNQDPVQSMK